MLIPNAHIFLQTFHVQKKMQEKFWDKWIDQYITYIWTFTHITGTNIHVSMSKVPSESCMTFEETKNNLTFLDKMPGWVGWGGGEEGVFDQRSALNVW